jgi:hypothetical protein
MYMTVLAELNSSAVTASVSKGIKGTLLIATLTEFRARVTAAFS